MLLSTALLSFALAAPPAAEAPEEPGDKSVELLLLDIRATDADEQSARVLQNVVAAELSEQQGLVLNTQADMRRLVELETEKTVLDCGAEACLAEVAGALGVRYVLFGELGRLGSTAALSLTLFDSEATRPLMRKTLRGQNVLELEPQLEPVVAEVLVKLGFTPVEVAVDDQGGGPSTGLIVASVGGAAAVALGVTALVADGSLADGGAEKGSRDAAFVGGWIAMVGAAAAVVVAGVGVGLMVME